MQGAALDALVPPKPSEKLGSVLKLVMQMTMTLITDAHVDGMLKS